MRDSKTLQAARAAETDPYRRRFTFPKWSRTVTVTDEPSIFRRLSEFRDWTKAEHLTLAKSLTHEAVGLQRAYSQHIDRAVAAYGNGNGSLISGIYRSHFPDETKDLLRSLARNSSEAFDRAVAHWLAAGKRIHTWRAFRDMAQQATQ